VGIAATLHRFGFYFRPATVGVFVFGIVAVVLTSTIMAPPKPTATVAEATDQSTAQPAQAPEDDGRVNVFFAESAKKADAGPAAASGAAAAPAASAAPARIAAEPAPGRANEAKGEMRQEPVLVASAETPREKREESVGFAPERDAPALAAAAPAPPSAVASRAVADESVAEGASLQKAAGSDEKRLRASAPQAMGGARIAASAQVVGKGAGTLTFSTPPRLDGLAGPFEGSYRLDLDGSGRVTGVVRLVGGSGSEPSGLSARLKELSFTAVEAAREAGSVDVKVRLP
jgi:hypothetical protein